ncbi:MAG: proline dehydrogenase family protein [Acidobacteria bacterium]|nr:proline dehydrogenase family protein [Acidobacteriota bacterium]
MSLLFRFARRFVAGESLDAAIGEVRRLNDAGLLVTLDFLGENVSNEGEAEAAAAEYVRMIEAINRFGLKANVSLKLTQMGLDLGDGFCQAQVERVVAKAADFSNFVRIDMEGTAYTDRTLDVFENVYRKMGNVGIVLQAYLHRTRKDLDRVVALKARVRLCKGAYAEPPTAAIQKMKDIRSNYTTLAEALFRSRTYPAIATHDEQLIRACARMAQEMGVGKEDFELQMLYGMRPARQLELAREGYRVRVYVPFGTAWLPYFYRRLRERKENIFFVVRNFFKS